MAAISMKTSSMIAALKVIKVQGQAHQYNLKMSLFLCTFQLQSSRKMKSFIFGSKKFKLNKKYLVQLSSKLPNNPKKTRKFSNRSFK